MRCIRGSCHAVSVNLAVTERTTGGRSSRAAPPGAAHEPHSYAHGGGAQDVRHRDVFRGKDEGRHPARAVVVPRARVRNRSRHNVHGSGGVGSCFRILMFQSFGLRF